MSRPWEMKSLRSKAEPGLDPDQLPPVEALQRLPGPIPLITHTVKCSQACKSSHHWEEVEQGLLDPPLDAQSTALPSLQGSAHHNGHQSPLWVCSRSKYEVPETQACSRSEKHTPEAKLGLW